MSYSKLLKQRRYCRDAENERIYLIRQANCFYCTGIMNTINNDRRQKTLDHIIPKSKGGCNSLKNFVVACKNCNSNRKDRDFIEFAIESIVKRKIDNVLHF